jgi:hypothetical protein
MASGVRVMSTAIHPQNVIALIWDFDKTLIPGYMQDPIFEEYGVDAKQFWSEVNALPEYLGRLGVRVHRDTAYLNHLLTHVQHGKMSGLTNARLRDLGARIKFHPGLPEFFELAKTEVATLPDAVRFEVQVEHYIVSTGLREMIEGSAIRPFVDGIWASEFIEEPPPPGFHLNADATKAPTGKGFLMAIQGIAQIAISYDNTSKTRALFEINKGSNTEPSIEVNAKIAAEDRRVPFSQMIYIADGPSDVPAFSLIRQHGGTAFAVYDDMSLEQVDRLRRDGRVDHFGPADYTSASPTACWLRMRIRQIAAQIVSDRKTALRERVGRAPTHVS